MPTLDTLIARIALSLWSSAKRVEKLPTVTEVQPWERAEIVPIPRECLLLMYARPACGLVSVMPFGPEGI